MRFFDSCNFMKISLDEIVILRPEMHSETNGNYSLKQKSVYFHENSGKIKFLVKTNCSPQKGNLFLKFNRANTS